MELYKYKAVDSAGKFSYGRFDALNGGDLEVRLRRLGLDLISYKAINKNRGNDFTGQGIKRSDLITFCFHLEQLIRAGVPILESLTDLRDSVDNERLREVITTMIESIGGGKSLSETMADFPHVFGEVFVNLIMAGEQSGELANVLAHINDNLKWQDEQAAYTKTLLIYPAFLLAIIIAVVFFLMIYLVPLLVQVVTNMGQELPWHTNALIAVSGFFTNYWYVIVALPIIVYFSVVAGMRSSKEFRQNIDAMKLRIPVIGPVLKKLIMTRFTNYFAIMYASGITVLECVKTGEMIVGNSAIAAAINDAGRQIADGTGISAAFDNSKLFPPLVIRMLKIGENTGALEKSLQNVSYFYTREVKESVDRFQKMLGPAMTVILGLTIAWIMFSVLGPIYDLISQIKV